ncbi:hypothetical protein [Bradyrhizobium sp. BWA-3-5]|uniref:hypothetical protein n=1 Tax=Bradyrhizobium sp. BWA-3-5 TaxID=3080013 RepID=UPI00293E23B9|nr:hypothetical protein [Bradyrhizobium sp. BWA-3-5]WOH68184.1 hypothetical protein RX331_10885 [Bradyrhizobium sp. BWA-3-5]
MKRVLVAYSASSTHVPTTFEYLRALKELPDCDVKFVHCTNDARLNFDINQFDVLINSYCARLCYDWFLSPDYRQAVLSFRGLKIAIVQDDYDRTAALHRNIRQYGFHVVFTSIQSEFWPLAYPAIQVPGVVLRQLLTGYAPARHVERRIRPLEERSVPVGYRGRQLGAKYGKLGHEKYEIGRRMAELCDRLGQPHDIRTDDASRIYGEDWFTFIGDCRAMLGSESGCNAFDFDQEIEKRCDEFATRHGRAAEYSDFADFLEPFEKPFNVGQISPRVFECASMKTPMILFRGRYSDAIKPDLHYIPLEKDFSNAQEVLTKLDNLEYLKGFANRAHEHLIASGIYSYRTLTSAIRTAIEEFYPQIASNRAIQHWRSIQQPWVSTHNPADPKTIALSEVPTDDPQPLSYFVEKQTRFSELLHQSVGQETLHPIVTQQARPVRGGALSACLRPLRKAWHLIPTSVRYRVGPLLMRLARRALVPRPSPQG